MDHISVIKIHANILNQSKNNFFTSQRFELPDAAENIVQIMNELNYQLMLNEHYSEPDKQQR